MQTSWINSVDDGGAENEIEKLIDTYYCAIRRDGVQWRRLKYSRKRFVVPPRCVANDVRDRIVMLAPKSGDPCDVTSSAIFGSRRQLSSTQRVLPRDV